jgi:hypothetical protein
MVEPGIEPGTSWLVVRSSDHQTTRLVGEILKRIILKRNYHEIAIVRFDLPDYTYIHTFIKLQLPLTVTNNTVNLRCVNDHIQTVSTAIAQSVQRIATSCTVRRTNPGGGGVRFSVPS